MNKIKNTYRVETHNKQEVEILFNDLISKSIEGNRENGLKKLVTISIRVSFESPIKNKKLYVTLLTQNIDFNKFVLQDIIVEIMNKLNNRNITPTSLYSLHIHLYYL